MKTITIDISLYEALIAAALAGEHAGYWDWEGCKHLDQSNATMRCVIKIREFHAGILPEPIHPYNYQREFSTAD